MTQEGSYGLQPNKTQMADIKGRTQKYRDIIQLSLLVRFEIEVKSMTTNLRRPLTCLQYGIISLVAQQPKVWFRRKPMTL
jgi:hypothetical protein